MSPGTSVSAEMADDFLALYDRGLPQVYGYLVTRCGSTALAEDLTGETFLAAVAAVQKRPSMELSVGWLVTVARNKLVDHWRRQAVEVRTLQAVPGEDDGGTAPHEDRWIEALGGTRAAAVLEALAPQHRLALTLRYVDDLPVPEVAAILDRTLHATEALLVRARRAFRDVYETQLHDGGEP